MIIDSLPMSFSERVAFSLRSLYSRHGYSQYKMSKFEEYDLYAKNKDFLISDGVITFTDAGGKLMALKPDVTLSIVKNSKDEPTFVQKLYYNENVYRADKGSRSYREIMQVGLECLGKIDDYCISEVIMLAAMSLASISEQFVLDISDLGLILTVINALGIPLGLRDSIIKCIGEKNCGGIKSICEENGVSDTAVQVLTGLVSIYGAPSEVLPQVKKLLSGICDTTKVYRLERILCCLEKSILDSVRIDFSVVDNLSYYNGILFKGFVLGIPESLLSGGCYDSLMLKMNKRSGAVGFAVYTDRLALLGEEPYEYDVDTLLLYGDDSTVSQVHAAAEKLAAEGVSVSVQRDIPRGLKYRRLLKLCEGEVKTDA